MEVSGVAKKTHAVAARSTFRSQNVKKTTHFQKLRCSKMAQGCGAKHISKSKCQKHMRCVGTFLDVDMLKKCTELWCEPHFEVKMLKALESQST